MRKEPEAEAPPPPPGPGQGALEEWVARVRAAAPELLVGLDLPPGDGTETLPAPPRVSRPESPVGLDLPPVDAGGMLAGGVERAEPRDEERGAGARSRDRSGALGRAGNASPAPRVGMGLPSTGRTGDPAAPSPRAPGSDPVAPRSEPPTGLDRPPADGAGARARPGDGARDQDGACTPAPLARPEPTRILRWTGRAQRAGRAAAPPSARPHGEGWQGPPSPEVAAHAPLAPQPTPAREAPPPPIFVRGRASRPDGTKPPDEASTSRAADRPWNTDSMSPNEVRPPPGARRPPRPAPPRDVGSWPDADLPGPWPDLPPEPPATDLEDAFLRRMERLHRIAREQRED